LTAVFELTLDEIDEAIVEAFMEAADVDADVQFPADSSQSLAAHHDKIAIQSKSVMRTARTDPVVPDIPLTYCEMDALQLSRLAADSDLYSRFYIVAAPSDKQLNIRSSDGALKVAVDESVKVADESNVVEKVLDEPIGSNCRGGGGTAEMADYKAESAVQSKTVMRTAREDATVPDVPLTYCEMDVSQISRLSADSELYSHFHIVAAPSDKQLNIRSSDEELKVAVDESLKHVDESNVVDKVLDEPIGSTCQGGGGTAEIPIEFTDDKHDEDELDEELAFYTGTYQSTGTATETSDDAHDEDVESEAESTVVVQHSCLANENRAHDELPLLPDAFDEWMDDLVAERKALGCAFHDSCVFGEPICVY
jgi:hypothetical protein